MFWKRRVVVERAPVWPAEKIVEALSVDPETPLLQGVLAVLAGMEEMEKEMAAMPKLGEAERAFVCGKLAMAGEAQERILELVRVGNERKKGKKGA